MLDASKSPLKSRFDVAVAALLRSEGGLVEHPSDPGGITKFGISLRFLVAEGKLAGGAPFCDVNRDGRIDGRDIRSLTPATAATLYRRCFWDRSRLHTLPPPIDAIMLDQCVNMGPGTAIRLLEAAIGEIAGNRRLDDATDAALGAAIGRIGMTGVIAAYRTAARVHYSALVAANPKLAVFAKGWNARVDRLGTV